jgi:hypothetical protein
LRKNDVKRHLLRSAPTTYQEALEYAQREQAVWESTGRPDMAEGEPMEVNRVGEGPENRSRKCFNCEALDHFARDCPQPWKARPPQPSTSRGRGAGRGRGGRGTFRGGRGGRFQAQRNQF